MKLRIAATICFLAVALGAFGAHALRATLERHQMGEVWKTAVLYHLVHGVALFALALWVRPSGTAWWLLLAGVILFSGSLYLMALVAQPPNWLGVITPIGGLCFLAGWAWLILSPPKL